MKSSEAFLLRKVQYGEADYILSLFTKDFGSIKGLAKNAKKSRKRFGGRLEPFVHFQVNFSERPGGIKFIEDSQVIRAFPSLMEDIGLFTWGSFVLENVDILLPEEEPNGRMFDLVFETLEALDLRKNPLATVLKFQLSALTLAGYKPNLDHCVNCRERVEADSFFSVNKGGVLCYECREDRTNSYVVSRSVLLKQDFSQDDIEALNHINLLTNFTEYHTGKEIKTSKFLEELVK